MVRIRRTLVALAVVCTGVPVAAAAALQSAEGAPRGAPGRSLAYPKTHTVDVVDDYHGTEVADPYRWLEDTDAPEVRAWIEAQNAVTEAYLSAIPSREALRERLTELWNFPRQDAPERVGPWLVFSRNDGLQNQAVLLKQRDGEPPQVLLDPNLLAEDGTVAVSGTSLSEDGRYLAYALSSGGSDWKEWRVRELESGQDLPDVVRWSKFSTAEFDPSGAGFYYCRYPAPAAGEELAGVNRNQTVWYHRLGTSQEEDDLVYERPDHPDWGFHPIVTEDGRYLVLLVSQGTDPRNLVLFSDLRDRGPMQPIVEEFEAEYAFLANRGPVFYFRTDREAPRGRIVSLDVTRLPQREFREVVPEGPDALQSATVVHDQLLLTRLHHASHRVDVHGLDGTPAGTFELPGLGSVGGFTGKSTDRETWFTFLSFTVPPTVFHHDFRTGRRTVWFQPEVDFDSAAYTTRLEFARSRDGTAVPYFLTARRGLERTGAHPTLLYGYGGFNASMTPRFSPSNLVWLELGGLWVQAVLRGGAEYGEDWHQAGMLDRKQNVFDDFLAVAEHLIDAGYTSPEKLAIHGGSNGGLLVGAVVNQRPDLFAAAVPAVGVMDMLRFHKFTIGWAWVPEYGSSDDPAQFPFLQAYSPLHNIRPQEEYPATLILTGDHDDRVVPGHSFKYAAALQQAQAGPDPILLRIETRAGHGAGKPTRMRIEEQADLWAFLVHVLDVPAPDGASE